MIVSTTELAALLREVEAEDPIDYGDMPYDEDDLRLMVCNQVREIAEQAEHLGEEHARAVLLAVAAKLVLENLVLHIRLMRMQGEALDKSGEALFQRLRQRPGL